MPYRGKVAKVTRAIEFLEDRITEEWKTRIELLTEAKALGLSQSVVEKAAHLLDIQCRHVDGGPHGNVEWHL